MGELAIVGPRISSVLTVQRAQDSMSMVMMNLDKPPIPVIPKAARVPLVNRMIRIMIMRVRRTLSETEIEKYTIGGQ